MPKTALAKKVGFFKNITRQFNLITPFTRTDPIPVVPVKKLSKNEALRLWARHLLEAKPRFLSLYLHVPFCNRARCTYCMYHSQVLSDARALDTYLNYLDKEASFFAPIFSKTKFSTLYIGGGTPSIMSAKQLKRLFEIVFAKFKFNGRGTKCFEASPETFGEEKIMQCKNAGFDRISLGVQSLDKQVLRLANRKNPPQPLLEQKINEINSLGLNDFNVDLMLGLPGDSEKKFLKGLEKMFSLAVPSVTIYTYRHDPLKFRGASLNSKNPYAVYSEPYSLEKPILLAWPLAKKYGYFTNDLNPATECHQFRKIGHDPKISNPAEPDFKLGNSTLGLGVNSKSFLGFGVEYYDWSPSYGKDFGETAYNASFYSKMQQMRDFTVLSLYRKGKVSLSEFYKRFGEDFEVVFQDEIKSLKTLGKATCKNGKLKLFSEGLEETAVLSKFFYDPDYLKRLSNAAGISGIK